MNADLSPFCDRDGTRYNLSAPFVRDGWQYATDGRIAVRVPTTAPDTSDGTFPRNIGDLFADFPECVMPLPDWEMETTKCRDCRGYGRVPVECPTCHGAGEHDCQCGTDHECGLCRGAGMVPGNKTCRTCDDGHILTPRGECPGDGEVVVITLDGARFNTWYLGLILRAFSNVRYAVARREIITGSGADGLCFVADGDVQGILCPTRWQNEED